MKKGILISTAVIAAAMAGTFIGSNNDVHAMGYPELLQPQN